MQFKKTLVRLFVFLLPVAGWSQSTYLSQGDKQNILLERMEIKAGTDSVLNFSKVRYFNRNKYVINGVRSYLQKVDSSALSKADAYNLRSLYMNNTEWLTPEELELYKSKSSRSRRCYQFYGNAQYPAANLYPAAIGRQIFHRFPNIISQLFFLHRNVQ